MDPAVPLCWALMPRVLERASRFHEKYGSDTPAKAMRDCITQNFVLDVADPDPQWRPKAVTFVGVVGKDVVAHAVMLLQRHAGEFYAEVHQYEKDRGARVPRDQFEACYAVFLAWARSMKVQDLRIVARNRAVAKVFEKSYGFRGERVIMRRPLSSSETTEAPEPTARVLRIAGRGALG